MKCKHCGEEIADGARFCENCGNKVEVEESFDTYKEPERVDAEVVSDEAPKMDYTMNDSYDNSSSESTSYSSASDDAVSENKADGPIGYSIAALVCGILGLICCCCGWFGIIVSVAGIVLGVVSLKKNCEGRGMAIAGIVCGGIGALVAVITVIIAAASGSLFDGIGNINNIDDISDFLDSL